MNRQAVANVIGYYANQVGITYQGKDNSQNKGKGIIGLKESPGKLSDVNPAFTVGNDIYVNKKGGKINYELFDSYNLKSVLVHEKDHKEKGQGFKTNLGDNLDHAKVYLTQISDENFAKGTSKFQEGILNSMATYLKNAVVKDDHEDQEIESLIEKQIKRLENQAINLCFEELPWGQMV